MTDRVQIIVGDMLEALRALPDNSVDSVVTDPPYHLTSIVKRFGAENAAPAKSDGATGVYGRASKGFMGQTWDGGDIAFRAETWAEVFRVLKPGGHLAAFSGTRTYHRMAVAIEDAGFEIRDQLGWAYGTGFPKSLDIGKAIDKAAGAKREVVGEGKWKGRESKADLGIMNDDAWTGGPKRTETAPATAAAREWEGWGTALKPAWEPICLARKPLSEKSVAANVLKWGTGALNIDGCRIESGADYHELSVTQGGDHFSIQSAEKTRGTTFKPAEGRWPANLCHDGSDEVLAGFPRDAGANPVGRAAGDYAYTQRGQVPNDAPFDYADSGSAARFFYCAKAGKLDRLGSDHPTVKPVSLMRWLVRLVTPLGGATLDPFAGTGSTGIAAFVEGFDAVLVELRQEAADDIQRRLDHIRGLGRTTALELARLDDKDETKRAKKLAKARGDDLPLFGAGQ